MGAVHAVRRQNQGYRVFDDRELAVYGLTIAHAIKFTLTITADRPPAFRLNEAIGSNRIETSCQTIQARIVHSWLTLQKVSNHFEGRSDFRSPQRKYNYLSSLGLAPETWNTIRRDCVTLWR